MLVNQTQGKQFSHFRFLRAAPRHDQMNNIGLIAPSKSDINAPIMSSVEQIHTNFRDQLPRPYLHCNV